MNLYLIKPGDGKYYRSKGYGAGGSNWQDNPIKAKIFTRESSARQIISWRINNYPQYPAPALIKLSVFKEEIILIDLKEVKIKN